MFICRNAQRLRVSDAQVLRGSDTQTLTIDVLKKDLFHMIQLYCNNGNSKIINTLIARRVGDSREGERGGGPPEKLGQ